MIEHMVVLIESFPGAANQTRCFAHILNLVAKSVLRQFEGPKGKSKKVIDDAAKELAAIFDEIDDDAESGNNDAESGNNDADHSDVDDVDDDAVDDDEDGLQDGRDEMSEEELTSLEESVKPIRLVLTKVINSIQ